MIKEITMEIITSIQQNVNNRIPDTWFDEEFYQAEDAFYEQRYGVENLSLLQQKVDAVVLGTECKNPSSGFINNLVITSTHALEETVEKSVEAITADFEEWYNGKLEETVWGVFTKQVDDELKVRVMDISDKVTKRYFKVGRKRMLAKLARRLDNTATCGIHLVLTFDPRKVDLKTAWGTVWTNFKRLMDALNIARKRKFGTKRRFGYVAVLEEQPGTGYPHLHVWFPQLRFLWNIDKLTEWWGQANNSVNVEFKQQASVVSYVCNYIAKLGKWSKTALAMLWHFGRRLYSISKYYYVRKLPLTEWRLVAVCKTEQELADALYMLECFVGPAP